jgi:hypothetical protein
MAYTETSHLQQPVNMYIYSHFYQKFANSFTYIHIDSIYTHWGFWYLVVCSVVQLNRKLTLQAVQKHPKCI